MTPESNTPAFKFVSQLTQLTNDHICQVLLKIARQVSKHYSSNKLLYKCQGCKNSSICFSHIDSSPKGVHSGIEPFWEEHLNFLAYRVSSYWIRKPELGIYNCLLDPMNFINIEPIMHQKPCLSHAYRVSQIFYSFVLLALESLKESLKVNRSQIKIAKPKINGRICFSILTTRKYFRLEFRFQVSSISVSSG